MMISFHLSGDFSIIMHTALAFVAYNSLCMQVSNFLVNPYSTKTMYISSTNILAKHFRVIFLYLRRFDFVHSLVLLSFLAPFCLPVCLYASRSIAC